MGEIEKQVDNLFDDAGEAKDYSPLEITKMQKDIEFTNKMIESPIKDETYSKKILGKSMTFQPFLEMLMIPEGIYEGDKYLQMVAGWKYELLKRLLRRRRRMPFNWTWLFIVIGLGVMAILVIIIVLGLIGGM